jgi:hypothetical protein
MGGVIGTVVSMAVFVAILGIVAFALFELSPFAHHRDVYHQSGERQQSPRLD